MAPVPVQGLNDGNYRQMMARLSPDELTVYLARDLGDGNQLQIMTGKRASTESPFGTLDLVPQVNSDKDDDDATVSSDGLLMYVESNRSGNYQIYAATRPSIGDPFSAATALAAFMTGADGGPYLVPASTTLYFHSYRAGSPDIYRATPVGGDFQIEAVSTINSVAEESFPAVTPDELTIYFSSDRKDGGAKGGEDIWVATRSSRADAFESPRNVQELNTTADERPSWISPDGCRLYMQRNVMPGGSVMEIDVAEHAR
jgi:Tol biopolymer transport system component